MSVEQNPDRSALNHTLVDNLVEQKVIASAPVEAAFRAVRREIFLPDLPVEEVYKNRAIITKVDERERAISSSSQPAMMAVMLEQLDLQPGHNVLEIGAGTGYNAAVMAHIVGEEGQVTTMDIEADLVDAARTYLAAAGFERVQVICGDGMFGYADNAPYDRILLTVAGWDIPPEWLAQLRPDGRLLLPLSFYGPQLCIAFERQEGHLLSHSIKGCGFMPVRGARCEPLHETHIGGRREVTLMRVSDAQGQQSDPAALEAWLRGPFVEEPAEIELSGGELLFKWPLWAALEEADHVFLNVYEEAAAEELVPGLLPPWRMSTGILTGSGLALLATPSFTKAAESEDPFMGTFALHVRSYGADKTVAARLLHRLQAWDSAGRPWSEGTTVWAVPADESPAFAAADVCRTRRWHHFCIRWESD